MDNSHFSENPFTAFSGNTLVRFLIPLHFMPAQPANSEPCSAIMSGTSDNNFDYSKIWALYKQKGKRIINPHIRKSVIDVFRSAGERGLRERDVVNALEELGYDRDTIEHYVHELYEEIGALEVAREDKKNVRQIKYYRLIENLRGPMLPDPVKKPAYTWIFDKLDILKNEFLQNFRYFSHLTCDSGVMFAGQTYKLFLQTEHIKNQVRDKTSQETLQLLNNLSTTAVSLQEGFSEYAETGKTPIDFYEKVRNFLSSLQNLYDRAHKVGEGLDVP